MQASFQMWNNTHYFMMVFPFIGAIFLALLLRKQSDKKKRMVGVVLSILMIIILGARSIFMIVKHEGLNPEAIPFQVCHFANFMILAASLSKNKTVHAIVWCLNFPAGLVSVIFANGLENYDNILNIQGIAYIAGHMLIVLVGLYLLLVGIIEINHRAMLKMFGVIGIAFGLSVLVNNWFNHLFKQTGVMSNYFYTFKPEEGTPLENIFEMGSVWELGPISFNPVYLLLLGIVAIGLFYLMFVFYQLRSLFVKS
jgi:Integral membrane protein (intg_mem_TP0381)